MKQIDDVTFVKFVNNLLSKDEMIDVEKQLIADKEAPATLYASISNYEVNKEQMHEILGIEENIEINARNIDSGDSVIVENETKLFNKTIMNIRISKEEAQKIQVLFAAYKESENAELKMDENLINFYLTQCPGTYPEEAEKVVKGIRMGIETFNENLNKALKEESINYVEEIKNIGENLTNEQKYELYINYLSAIHVLNIQNFDAEHASQIEGFDTIKKGLAPTGNVTDDMLDDLIEKIADALNNNTLCLASIEAMKDLQDALAGGTENIKEVLRGSESDMRTKLVAALTTYVAYRNDDITSLNGQEITPEIIAVAVSSGIEQAQVVEDVRTGKTTVDTAIKVLKFIGGIALWTTLALAVAYVSIYLATFAFGAFVSMLGTSVIALIVAGGAALACCLGIFNSASDIIGEIVDWAGSAFDWIVNGWRQTVWPIIKEKSEEFITWIGNLFANQTVVQTTQLAPISTVVAES